MIHTDDLKQYSKTIAVVVGAILNPLLGMVGITMDTTVEQAIYMLVVAGIVYFVPNRQVKKQ